jgi:spore germination cell wall hydrolase CwlJ-like protein
VRVEQPLESAQMRTLNKLLIAGALVFGAFSTQADDPSVICLAKNIYYEAQGESLIGKLAVAKVTLNRVTSPKFPNSVCGVVYQKYQFSWTLTKQYKIRNLAAWQESLNLARDAIYNGLPELENFKALYFHNKQVNPRWNRKRLLKIGNHIFYG